VIEIFPHGILDKLVEFDDFITDKKIAEQRTALASK
jgi:hypothetical protein